MSGRLTDEDIDALVELDRINMSPLIAAAGATFDAAFRRAKLVREIREGAIVDVVRRGRKLVGYLEYGPKEDGSWRIYSIQMHPDMQGRGVLRDLFAVAAVAVRVQRPGRVTTSVHRQNERSISLHQRLGFEQEGENGDRIEYVADGVTLGVRLKRYERTRKATRAS
jgi:ribosomal protein S18 acetylase RimI-like enzyme